MFKGVIVAGAYTSGYLPLTKLKNTNTIFELSNNQVSIQQSGLVDVKANIIIEATGAGDVTAQLYGDGNAISGATYTVTAASGDTYTLTINDVVQVTNQADADYAAIGIQLSAACTLIGGDMICEYRQ